MRPSRTFVFVVGALAVAASVGVSARRPATAAEDASAASGDLPLPVDIPVYGFKTSAVVNGVAVLEATREFRMSLPNGPVHGQAPEAARGQAARAILARELGRYPRGWFSKVRLAGVVLADALAEGETPIPSLPNVAKLLLLDVGAAEQDLVRAIHHEVWHFADLADDGSLSPDPAWTSLNVPGTFYGAGGRTLRATWAARPSDELMGFVSAYATSGEEEDKAETFAFVVARLDAVRARLPQDPALAAKVRELRRRAAAIDSDAPGALGFPE